MSMEYLLSAPTIQYCEAALDMVIARPWYALSNLAFIAVGIVVVARGGRYSKLFGSLALLVGVLSFTYDATYTYLSQLLDLAGMLSLIGVLLYLNLRLFATHQRRFILGLVATIIASLVAIIFFRGFAGNVLFGLFVLSYIASELYLLGTKRHKHGKRWLLALIIFAIGFVFWLCDASHVYCLDFGLLNGRSVFHYTNAVTLYLLYVFYLKQPNRSTI